MPAPVAQVAPVQGLPGMPAPVAPVAQVAPVQGLPGMPAPAYDYLTPNTVYDDDIPF